MKTSKIAEYAHSLYRAHGGKAESEAAQKERQAHEAGDTETANEWRLIREAISEMRGPRQG